MKQYRHFCRGILLHGRQGMGIDIKRDLDSLMPKSLLHHFDRDTGLQQQCRTGMTQTMELDRSHPSGLDDPPIFMLTNVVHQQGMA